MRKKKAKTSFSMKDKNGIPIHRNELAKSVQFRKNGSGAHEQPKFSRKEKHKRPDFFTNR